MKTGKTRKKSFVGTVVAGIFLILPLLLIIRCILVGNDASALVKQMSEGSLNYSVDLELEGTALSQKQQNFFTAMSALTGKNEGELMNLHMEGEFDSGVLHATFFSAQDTEPILEIYVSEQSSVINGAMLYNRIRQNLVAQSGILGQMLIPVWNENPYITLEQFEQLTDTDLSMLSKLTPVEIQKELSVQRAFPLLLVMSRRSENGRITYKRELGQTGVAATLYKKTDQIELKLHSIDPVEEIRGLEKYTRLLKLRISEEQLNRVRVIRSIDMNLKKGNREKLSVPDSILDQKILDAIALIRDFLR